MTTVYLSGDLAPPSCLPEGLTLRPWPGDSPRPGTTGREPPSILVLAVPDSAPRVPAATRSGLGALVVVTGGTEASRLRLAGELPADAVFPSPPDATALWACVERLARPRPVGLEAHLGPEARIELHTFRSLLELKALAGPLQELLPPETFPEGELLLEELGTNALFHGPRDAEGQPRFRNLGSRSSLEDCADKRSDYREARVSREEEIIVAAGRNGRRAAIAVTDPFGSMIREQVLSGLERQALPRAAEAPPARLEPGGRGLHIVRARSSALEMDVAPGRWTQVTAILESPAPTRTEAPLVFRARPGP